MTPARPLPEAGLHGVGVTADPAVENPAFPPYLSDLFCFQLSPRGPPPPRGLCFSQAPHRLPTAPCEEPAGRPETAVRAWFPQAAPGPRTREQGLSQEGTRGSQARSEGGETGVKPIQGQQGVDDEGRTCREEGPSELSGEGGQRAALHPSLPPVVERVDSHICRWHLKARWAPQWGP